MALARRRKRIVAFSQRPEDAQQAVTDLRQSGRRARLADAGPVRARGGRARPLRK